MASAGDDDLDPLRPISIENGVVTRPAGPWTPTVHEFLRHLRGQGLTCVPEPIDVDGEVERLVVIEGDAGPDGWQHQHSDAGLRSAVRLLRSVHDASVGWLPPTDAVFRAAEVVSDAETVWCHGDVGPWNMVWHGEEAVGLIDWDFLHRGPRLDDVAYALRWFAPARDDQLALEWHHFPAVPDRAHRVQVFLETYGGLPPLDVAETIAARMEVTMAHELALTQAGVEPQRTWVAEGSQEWAAGEARWVRDHAHLLTPQPIAPRLTNGRAVTDPAKSGCTAPAPPLASLPCRTSRPASPPVAPAEDGPRAAPRRRSIRSPAAPPTLSDRREAPPCSCAPTDPPTSRRSSP